MFYKNAFEVSPAVMTATLMSTFHINATQLGNLVAGYFYAYLIMQMPAGILLDRLGPRKVTTTAIILFAFGNYLFAQANSVFLAGAGRFLTGVGASFAAVNCLKLIANWFPLKQFSVMTGLMMTLAMSGAIIGQAPLGVLIDRLGWQNAFCIVGIAGLVLAVIFWSFVRDQPSHHKKEVHIAPVRASVWASLKKLVVNPQNWWLSVYSGFAFAPIMVFAGLWGVPFISQAFYISKIVAAQATSLSFIGFAVGAPILGWFSEWIGKRKVVMFWGTITSLISISLVIYTPNISYSLLTFLLFIFGFSISSFLLCFTMLREINPPILAATAVGFMNAFDAFFGAFSDPLTGKFLDLNWTGLMIDGARVFSVTAYKLAFLTIPVYLVIALLSLVGIKETYCKSVEEPLSPLP